MNFLRSSEKKGLLWRELLDTKEIMNRYPPKFMNPHKSWIYSQIPFDKTTSSPKITISRWQTLPLPFKDEISHPRSGKTLVISHPEMFKYAQTPQNNNVKSRVWYLNFADRNLFGYYQGALFAQDEMQIVEHPILGSIRHWLEEKSIIDNRFLPNSQNSEGNATPYLLQNIERRVFVSTDENKLLGRPFGLYGNNFMQATPEAIKNATHILNPPTLSNILAISAISKGHGRYTRHQINKLFSTLYIGFMAARIESQQCENNEFDEHMKTIIHTGNWGCGAFGGNPILIAILQITAAFCVGIDKLIYHTLSKHAQFTQAKEIFENDLKSALFEKGLSAVLLSIEKLGLEWGMPDGN